MILFLNSLLPSSESDMHVCARTKLIIYIPRTQTGKASETKQSQCSAPRNHYVFVGFLQQIHY